MSLSAPTIPLYVIGDASHTTFGSGVPVYVCRTQDPLLVATVEQVGGDETHLQVSFCHKDLSRFNHGDLQKWVDEMAEIYRLGMARYHQREPEKLTDSTTYECAGGAPWALHCWGCTKGNEEVDFEGLLRLSDTPFWIPVVHEPDGPKRGKAFPAWGCKSEPAREEIEALWDWHRNASISEGSWPIEADYPENTAT
jgi:hypothetical protein